MLCVCVLDEIHCFSVWPQNAENIERISHFTSLFVANPTTSAYYFAEPVEAHSACIESP